MTRTFAQPLPTDPRQLLGWDEKQQKWIINRDQTMSLIRTWNRLVEIEREFLGKDDIDIQSQSV